MDKNKLSYRLLSNKIWRDWWINRLVRRPNRLYDYETQEPMIVEKRIYVEVPRLDDYIDFFCYFGVMCRIKTIGENIGIELTKGNKNRIMKVAESSLKATELALVDFLKEKNMIDRWD